jgi:phage/plasmid-associated DNA primase
VVDNGTYDLYAQVFRPSDPADLMTLAGGVAYDPDAECPLYDHLMSLYQPDPHGPGVPAPPRRGGDGGPAEPPAT